MTSSSVDPVVTVGLRPGAVEAAERMGRPVVAVVDKAPGPRLTARLAGVVEASFDGPAEVWTEVADQLRPSRPAAVVALTERSVVPAAHVRTALGQPGNVRRGGPAMLRQARHETGGPRRRASAAPTWWRPRRG